MYILKCTPFTLSLPFSWFSLPRCFTCGLPNPLLSESSPLIPNQRATAPTRLTSLMTLGFRMGPTLPLWPKTKTTPWKPSMTTNPVQERGRRPRRAPEAPS
ncbi:hypothetical protein ATCV1_z408L [Acanthocystis turfacea chlorella virus 1]|uniref:Uncharacterized protein z408L n=1 Tax=Chlorovirus heliozoae TaxID=322019 RepID=A7K918_9PHYC|nr:hypothetical protein ATCV1_z408L [Acanthocystis turfacea chlorella virus 1]ABT16542.1 hypothetical protein ATCV1_z408L [Acanthocystis turfacea chlorella virus 1]